MKYHEISRIRDECGNTVEEILHQLVAIGNYETL